MKKLLFILTLVTGLVALSPLAGAKDHDKDKDRDKDHDKDHYEDRDKKDWKDLRNSVREMREQYGRLTYAARQYGTSRRLGDQISLLGADVDRASAQFERGNYDGRDLRGRVAQLNDSVNRTREQLEYERTHRDRWYR